MLFKVYTEMAIRFQFNHKRFNSMSSDHDKMSLF